MMFCSPSTTHLHGMHAGKLPGNHPTDVHRRYQTHLLWFEGPGLHVSFYTAIGKSAEITRGKAQF